MAIKSTVTEQNKYHSVQQKQWEDLNVFHNSCRLNFKLISLLDYSC